MNADLKSLQLLRAHHTRISRSQFDESDLLAVLILLREIAPSTSPLREIAHFVAHRRRDRGDFHQFVLNARKESNSASISDQITVADVENVISVGPVYRDVALFRALNEAFFSCSLSALGNDLMSPIITCVISLLQDVRFTENEKDVGKTTMWFTKNNVALLGQYADSQGRSIVVPVLTTKNVLFPISSDDPKQIGVTPNDGAIVRIVRLDGILQAETQEC